MTVSMHPLHVAHIHVQIHVRMRLLDIVVWLYVCNGWFCSGGCSVCWYCIDRRGGCGGCDFDFLVMIVAVGNSLSGETTDRRNKQK